jgi:hypothetical protein
MSADSMMSGTIKLFTVIDYSCGKIYRNVNTLS